MHLTHTSFRHDISTPTADINHWPIPEERRHENDISTVQVVYSYFIIFAFTMFSDKKGGDSHQPPCVNLHTKTTNFSNYISLTQKIKRFEKVFFCAAKIYIINV